VLDFFRWASTKQIDAHVPEVLGVHIVMDNYATHKTPKIKAWLARRPHYHVHFTPTSASWINQVERWFAELTRKRLQRVGSYLRQAARSRYPRFHRSAQPKSQPLQMDQICRPNPGFS
jgi:transposase